MLKNFSQKTENANLPSGARLCDGGVGCGCAVWTRQLLHGCLQLLDWMQ